MQLSSIQLSNLNTEADASKVNQLLSSIAGVASAKASIDTKKVALSFDSTQTSLQELKDAVTAGGFLLAVHGEDGNCCGGCGS